MGKREERAEALDNLVDQLLLYFSEKLEGGMASSGDISCLVKLLKDNGITIGVKEVQEAVKDNDKIKIVGCDFGDDDNPFTSKDFQ